MERGEEAKKKREALREQVEHPYITPQHLEPPGGDEEEEEGRPRGGSKGGACG